jgi:hypothetical protein
VTAVLPSLPLEECVMKAQAICLAVARLLTPGVTRQKSAD